MLRIRENEPLNRHTTLRVGGPARFFIAAKTEEEIKEALKFARTQNLPIHVLGGGSNLWVSDGGIEGVVLKIATVGVGITEKAGETVELVAEAGEEWDRFVGFTVDHGLYGFENMSLIPGTVGGAVVGNIGAYGAEVKDTILWTEALDKETGVVRRFAPRECAFEYRRSFFKTLEGQKFIVLRTGFRLKQKGTLNLSYKDLKDYFATQSSPNPQPTLARVREVVIGIRRRKLPDVACVGTAGSFFKNPVIPQAEFRALAARYPGLPGHDEGSGRVKIPLGWVLDKACGLKGVRHGAVSTHSEQALVIVNGGGTAAEVEAFADFLAGKVKQTTGLLIEWEVVRFS